MQILPGVTEPRDLERRYFQPRDQVQRVYELRQVQAAENRAKATLLKENLRYRGFVRRGTISRTLQTIGDGVRSQAGFWFMAAYWLLWIYLAAAFRGF